MNKQEFQQKLSQIDIYDSKEYYDMISLVKHNLCQNFRIARKLSHINPETAATLLGLEPQSLRRIEAENDRDEFSTRVFIMAIMIYEPDANFYFRDWKDNEKLLLKKDN